MKTIKFLQNLLVCMAIKATVLQAQEIKVRNICELTTDITARSEARFDDQGKECALVRVNIPTIRTIEFKNIQGNAEYKAGEYVFYIKEGTRQIPFNVQNYKDGVIDFDKHGINVKGKCVYRVTLAMESMQEKSQVTGGKLRLTTTPENALVLIDGIPMGETPLTIDDITAGKHIISFPNKVNNSLEENITSTGFTLADQTITIKSGKTTERHYNLEEKEAFNILEHIETECTNIDGSYSWPVKYREKEANGKKGLVDYWNREVVPCEYDYVDKNSPGDVFLVGLLDGTSRYYKVGLYEPGKGEILPCEYGNILWNNRKRLIKVCKDELWGLCNFDGNIIVPCEFNNISGLQYGVYVISQEKKEAGSRVERKKYGLLGADGRVIVVPQYAFITGFSEGYAFARDFDGNAYLIDTQGNTTSIPTGYDPEWRGSFFYYEGGCYTEGLLCLIHERKYGVLDCSGKEVVPFVYDKKTRVLDGWIVLKRYAKESKKYEYLAVDKNGHHYQLTEEEYHEFEGLYLHLERDGKHGLIDQNGKTVLPFEYIAIRECGSYFIANREGQTFIFDESLNELISFESDKNLRALTIKDDIILLCDSESNRIGYMNMKGELLAGCLYEDAGMANVYFNIGGADYLITHGLAMLCVGDRCGFIDKEGRIVVPLIYSAIIPFNDGTVYSLKQDGTWEELDLEKLKNKTL